MDVKSSPANGESTGKKAGDTRAKPGRNLAPTTRICGFQFLPPASSTSIMAGMFKNVFGSQAKPDDGMF